MLKMVKQSQINRGKKWADVKAKAVFEQRSKDVEWIDSQESIVKDIAAYEDSLKTEPEPKPKVKAKKASDEA